MEGKLIEKKCGHHNVSYKGRDGAAYYYACDDCGQYLEAKEAD